MKCSPTGFWNKQEVSCSVILESPSTLTAVPVGLHDLGTRFNDLMEAPRFPPPLCALQTKMFMVALRNGPQKLLSKRMTAREQC